MVHSIFKSVSHTPYFMIIDKNDLNLLRSLPFWTKPVIRCSLSTFFHYDNWRMRACNRWSHIKVLCRSQCLFYFWLYLVFINHNQRITKNLRWKFCSTWEIIKLLIGPSLERQIVAIKPFLVGNKFSPGCGLPQTANLTCIKIFLGCPTFRSTTKNNML